MTRNIPGALDLAAYEKLAQKHRPTNPEALAAEARRLYVAGHSTDYIAKVLRLPLAEVTRAIAERAPE